ncbi:MAG: TetR/AcrR family transcriptional regulator C-terminal domain-containing protein [Acidimicrobiales bacterium]|nr:TetR/AcrR family transcriptional regulator C-terminal domain-containing protein [Acidimicrobiales bacterium]
MSEVRGKDLSRTRVLDAAMALVDREGLERLTMRRLGQELGVEAMSLYHYVASKQELLDALVEHAIGEIELPPPDEAWDVQLRLLAHQFRQVGLRHPGVASLFGTRALRSVSAFAPLERSFSLLRAQGVPPEAAVDAVVTLAAFVFGYVLVELGGLRELATGRSVDFGVVGAAGHHELAELGAVLAAREPDEQFRHGVRLIVSAIGALVSRSAPLASDA